MFCYITGQSLYFYICNKWPTRGLWNKLSYCIIVCFSSISTTIGASDQDFPLSTGGGGLEERKF